MNSAPAPAINTSSDGSVC